MAVWFVLIIVVLIVVLLALLTWYLRVYKLAHECETNPNIWCWTDWQCDATNPGEVRVNTTTDGLTYATKNVSVKDFYGCCPTGDTTCSDPQYRTACVYKLVKSGSEFIYQPQCTKGGTCSTCAWGYSGNPNGLDPCSNVGNNGPAGLVLGSTACGTVFGESDNNYATQRCDNKCDPLASTGPTTCSQ